MELPAEAHATLDKHYLPIELVPAQDLDVMPDNL